MTFRSLRRTTLAFALALTPVAAFAQGECVDFDGLEHCALGNARISLDYNIMTIEDMAKMTDGVSVSFSEGVVWSSALSIEEDVDGGNSLTALAHSEGEVTATNTLERNDDGSLAISASFTGAAEGRTYSVQVYNGGVFQGGAGGIGDNDRYIFIDPRWHEDFIMWLIGQWTFYLRMDDGGCGWDLDLNEVRTLRLADGTELEGDEIRLQEEVKGDGHYAYTGFDGIDIVGHAASLSLSSASVMP